MLAATTEEDAAVSAALLSGSVWSLCLLVVVELHFAGGNRWLRCLILCVVLSHMYNVRSLHDGFSCMQ